MLIFAWQSQCAGMVVLHEVRIKAMEQEGIRL